MAFKKEVVVIPLGYKIKQSAIFQMDELYKELYLWFQHFHYSWYELEYRDDNRPDGSKHIEVKWLGEKGYGGYFTAMIELNFILLISPVEIELEGRRVKRDKGSVEFRLGAKLVKNEGWSEHSGVRFLRDVYEKYLIKERIEDYEKDLYTEVHKLIDEIKAFLVMHRYEENV